MPVLQPTPDPRPRPLITRTRLLVLAAALLAWFGAALWLFWPDTSAQGSRHLTDRLGEPGWERRDRACAECHPGEFAAHHGSGHSRTLSLAKDAPIARWLDGRKVADPEKAGVRWDFAFHNGKLDVDREAAGQLQQDAVEFAFGSGHNAVTFLTLTGTEPKRPESVELRLSYFARDRLVDITPGQHAESKLSHTTSFGRPFNGDETRKCFECHSTKTSNRGQDVLDVATMVPNIACERCHGPTGAHVEAARRGDSDLSMPFGDDRGTAEEQMRLCGQCHRLPSFMPADQIRPDNPVVRRFQSVGLMQSKCYTQSQGVLRCTTCHDPHARTSRDRATYETACRNCHQAETQTVCSTGRLDGCIECHMPRRRAGEKLLFSDHWIRPPSE